MLATIQKDVTHLEREWVNKFVTTINKGDRGFEKYKNMRDVIYGRHLKKVIDSLTDE